MLLTLFNVQNRVIILAQSKIDGCAASSMPDLIWQSRPRALEQPPFYIQKKAAFNTIDPFDA